MAPSIGIAVVFIVMLVLMALGITRGIRKKNPDTPQPEVGMWVQDALLWSPFAAFGNPDYDNRVTGKIVAVYKNGTMTVRDWESGDKFPCLAYGFLPVPAHEEKIMRRLRTEQDSHDLGESPSKAVH